MRQAKTEVYYTKYLTSSLQKSQSHERQREEPWQMRGDYRGITIKAPWDPGLTGSWHRKRPFMGKWGKSE